MWFIPELPAPAGNSELVVIITTLSEDLQNHLLGGLWGASNSHFVKVSCINNMSQQQLEQSGRNGTLDIFH